ncbi:isochorismatase [Liquorilactobacillus sucicola DSM 21376 = JCM 15457]|uniref:Isochorismatase n=1 Tax=Liquorilactobacillus sucicola DSM 21376 = JCM 15457 TaxID=1423806 RepID=A0A0R2E442_9LACO|nr:cysteine hydrolase family protein [Liquorilactobacillus sucicola]KRN07028.1 isochorismatase [Liquorilactobacillus sucicola DSM 21376 = JCM 15457]
MKQALLIIDVQNDYFENGRMELVSPQQALTQINKLEVSFKTRDLPIIYIQHIKNDPKANFFGRGTKGALLHSNLKVDKAAIVIEKHYPNSFFKTDLKELLESLEIEQVVITGMMTHMCVDSTTRASSELGYDPIVISDATATRNLAYRGDNVSAENVQKAFLAALQVFAQVITAKEYLG